MTLFDDSRAQPWPSLPLDAWSPTCATLHLWTLAIDARGGGGFGQVGPESFGAAR
jgi:hypothetical protein